jgi:hypothetical protein
MMFSMVSCTPANQSAEVTLPPTEPATIEPTATIASTGTAVPGPKGIPSDEYERAIWYGFLPEDLLDKDPDSTVVNWVQFATIMGNMIKRYDESAYPAWEELTRKVTATPMKRDGGMIGLVFGAQTIGMDAYNFRKWPPDCDVGNESSWDFPFDWEKPVALLDKEASENYHWPAYLYAFGFRISALTGQPLIDPIDNEARLYEDFTLRMAAVSIVRLYESDEDIAYAYAEAKLEEIKQTPEAQQIMAAADQRRETILNSETTIAKSDTYIQGETYTGTAYYLSNTGSDDSDGLSPETAWATIRKLKSVQFQFGDAVFFERGGIWREAMFPDNLRGTEGLTISAYGEGEKPRLYGSPENGTGADKWVLFYEGDNGEKIWKFYREMPDISVIVMNDGETYAKRDTPFWTGTEFVDMLDFSRSYVVEEQLQDMEFFTRLAYASTPVDRTHLYIAGYDQDGFDVFIEGPLYLRSDAGNPGELYSSIEFSTPHPLADGMSNYITLDNLNMSYGKSPVAGYWDGVSIDYVYFQNSEWGWSGGHVNRYGDYDASYTEMTGGADTKAEHIPSYVFMDGGEGNTNGSHTRVLNNYFHHAFQESPTLETFSGDNEPTIDNIYEGNLIEYSLMGFILCNWDIELNLAHTFSNIYIRDNMILFSGFEHYYSFFNATKRPERGEYWFAQPGFRMIDTHAFSTVSQLNPHDGTVSVSGNTFAFSASQLFVIEGYTEEYSHIYDGNTYAQLPGMIWLAKNDYVIGNPDPEEYLTDPDVVINDWIQDKNATILRFDE